MTYPSGITQGVPPQFQGNLTFVSDAAYQGGGYEAAYSRGQHYTYAQLERLWLDAGGDPSAAGDMAYIAEYDESGGDAGDWNSSGATGLLQEEWPSNYGSASNPASREKLFTPITNFKVAADQYSTVGFQPWGSDVHKDLGIKAAPAGSVPFENVNKGGNSGSGPDPAGGSTGSNVPVSTNASVSVIPSWLNDITSLFGFDVNSDAGNAKADITDLLERGALMIMGFILIVIGTFVLVRKSVPALNEGGAVPGESSKIPPPEEDPYKDKPYKSEAGKKQYEEYQDRETKKAYDKRKRNIDDEDRADNSPNSPVVKKAVIAPNAKVSAADKAAIPF